MYYLPLVIFSTITIVTLILLIEDIIKHSKPMEKILFIEISVMTGISIIIASITNSNNRLINYGILLIQITIIITTILYQTTKIQKKK